MGKTRTPAPRVAAKVDPRDASHLPAEKPGAKVEHQVTSEQQAAAAIAPKRKKSELVSVTLPVPMNLHDDAGVMHKYEPGVQDMPREHAEHWYAKALGLELNED